MRGRLGTLLCPSTPKIARFVPIYAREDIGTKDDRAPVQRVFFLSGVPSPERKGSEDQARGGEGRRAKGPAGRMREPPSNAEGTFPLTPALSPKEREPLGLSQKRAARLELS
jgi:hypothetical protein